MVLDEAYIDFSDDDGFLQFLPEFPNLIILQTLSKAWGMASLRLGMAFGNRRIIEVLDRIKPPYNVNGATQQIVYSALAKVDDKKRMVQGHSGAKTGSRECTEGKIRHVLKVYPSDANFLLVKMDNARQVYDYS